MQRTYQIITLVIALVAAIQLYGVGELVINASWQCFKFYDSQYENRPYISIDRSLFTFTCITSFVFIGLSIYISKRIQNSIISKINKSACVSLVIGIVLLAVLLFSNVAALVIRQ